MPNDKFNSSLNSFLSEGRIKHVINVLRSNCDAGIPSHPDLERLRTELDRLDDTYSRMRDFLIDGKSDPQRSVIYSSIQTKLKELARNYLFIINEDRLDPFFKEYRMQKVKNFSIAGLIADIKKNEYHLSMASETEADPLPFERKRESLIESIFLKTWVLPPWAKTDFEALDAALIDPEAPFELKSQIISSLMLGLLKFNDPSKLSLLIHAYEANSEDERLAARALTALVIVLDRWGNSALANEAISGSLDILSDSLLTYSRIREVVMTLVRTRDTDRVSREVNEAFRSTMKEISPEMLEKLQKEGMAVDSTETGLNPEWEKLMKNKELEEKMQAINDMQLEGMDVMMQTFARLKSFSFFRSIANWFLPFSTTNSEVSEIFRDFNREGFEVMADATQMCGGDRFSFILGIKQMPQDKRNLLASNVNASLEMMKDHVSDRQNVKRKSPFASEALSFARDIYRFAKLYPEHKNFYDPFTGPVDFVRIPLLGSLLADNNFILSVADFYFRYGYYAQALPLFESTVASGEADRLIFEKIGYCHQMNSDYQAALDNYEKADLFSTDIDRSSTWLLKKLAFTNKALGNYEKAGEYYARLLELDPDDLKLEFHLGSVLLRAGKVNEAMEHISKVHYIDPDHKLCSRLYSRIKGHEAFAQGNLKEALRLYSESRGERPHTEFNKELIGEIASFYPDADITTLRILLDEE